MLQATTVRTNERSQVEMFKRYSRTSCRPSKHGDVTAARIMVSGPGKRCFITAGQDEAMLGRSAEN